jgi:putative heme-binding domain-containing protein
MDTQDRNARVRLEALIALARSHAKPNPAQISGLLSMFPILDDTDKWAESAFLGVASENPSGFIAQMFEMESPGNYTELASLLSEKIGEHPDGVSVADLIILMSTKSARSDLLKQAILESMARQVKSESAPAWSPELKNALHTLLSSTNAQVAMLTVPIAAQWDKSGALTADINSLIENLAARLNDASQPDAERAQIARTLLAIQTQTNDAILSVAKILGSSASVPLQKQIIEILGGLSDSRVGTLLMEVYPKLAPELQSDTLNQLYKRADWSMALLDSIEAKKINITTLGPVAINRLRTHSNAEVAARANKIIDALRGPETKEKDALIAQFTPIVSQPGNAVNGREQFLKNCALCHKFKGEGKDVAPDLTGMGAHGPAELIVHVLDPNRSVEPNYYAYSIETKDGETYDGVIARENSASVTLRNAAGDTEIPVKDIKSRRNTGLSLMPNGFEQLGGETLRDILAYLCEGEANFRILDLQSAFTANTLQGLWLSEDNAEDSLQFKKFGVVKVDGVPFEIVNPLKSPSGKNVIVLKGGWGVAKTRPQRVEVKNVNVKAARLHFLGGVGGWAFPLSDTQKEMPVAKVTVRFADGQSEEIVLKNGVEFADWNGVSNVPGSRRTTGLIKRGQVRWFTKNLKHPGVILSLTIESFDNDVSPTFVAITADSSDAALPTIQASETDPTPAPREFKWAAGTIHVLILGGGSSHDFNRWFNQADSATLNAAGKISVNYTDKPGDLPGALKDVDVLFQCSNQIVDSQTHKAIMDFADAGHGLVLVHPGLWYNWPTWPEYNRVLVGGGAHGHDKYGEFEIAVKDPNQPVMAGVPASFKISDELYHSEIDPQGTPIEVLAEARNLSTGKTYPSIWIVKHPKARIVCIAPGHDAGAHDLDAYKTIIQNAVKWAANR